MLINSQWTREHTFQPDDILQIGPEVACKFAIIPACELQMQVHLYEQSILDDLTGLYNRRYLIDALRRAISSAHRRRKPLCLLLVDVDHFKQINDAHGHGAGDQILAHIATLIREALRFEDICARIGGEEFAVILREMDRGGCLEAAERIRTLIAGHPWDVDGSGIECTVSLGGVLAPEDRKLTSGDFLRLADANLYRAKHCGRNCTVIE